MAHRHQQSTIPFQHNSSFVLAQSTTKSQNRAQKSARKNETSQDTIQIHYQPANENSNPLTGSIISTKKHRASRNLLKQTPLKSEDKLSIKIKQVKNAIESYREYKSECSISQSQIEDCSKIHLPEDPKLQNDSLMNDVEQELSQNNQEEQKRGGFSVPQLQLNQIDTLRTPVLNVIQEENSNLYLWPASARSQYTSNQFTSPRSSAQVSARGPQHLQEDHPGAIRRLSNERRALNANFESNKKEKSPAKKLTTAPISMKNKEKENKKVFELPSSKMTSPMNSSCQNRIALASQYQTNQNCDTTNTNQLVQQLQKENDVLLEQVELKNKHIELLERENNELKMRNVSEALNESSIFREQELNMLKAHVSEAEKAQKFAEEESHQLYNKIEVLEKRKIVGKQKLEEMESLMITCKQQISTLDQITQMSQLLIEKLTKQVEEQDFELTQAQTSIEQSHKAYRDLVRQLEEMRKEQDLCQCQGNRSVLSKLGSGQTTKCTTQNSVLATSTSHFQRRHESNASVISSQSRTYLQQQQQQPFGHYSPTFRRQTPTTNAIHIVSQENGQHTESQVTMSKIQGEYVSQQSKHQMEHISPISSRKLGSRNLEPQLEGTIFLTNGSNDRENPLQERMKEFIQQIEHQEEKRTTLGSQSTNSGQETLTSRRQHFMLSPHKQ